MHVDGSNAVKIMELHKELTSKEQEQCIDMCISIVWAYVLTSG